MAASVAKFVSLFPTFLLFVVVLISWVDAQNSTCILHGLLASCTCGDEQVGNETLLTVRCTHLALKDPGFLRYVPLYADALVLQDITFSSEPHTDAFEQLTSVEEQQPFLKIKHLRMENVNSMSNVLLDTLLCSYPNLESAYLPNNTFRWATFNATCVPRLRVLDLSDNHIQYVLNHTLIELDLIPNLTIDFTRNPFICDCNLTPMLLWLPNATTHVQQWEKYVCADAYPEYISGRTLVQVNATQLRCQPDPETFEGPWSRADHNFGYLLYAILGFLMVVAFAILAFGFYYNFPYVRRWIKGVEKKPVMQRRRYKTLDTPA